MVNKEWLYRKILQNIGLNTLHQELLMKKKPDHFIILIKKEYSEYDAIYDSEKIDESTRSDMTTFLTTAATTTMETTEAVRPVQTTEEIVLNMTSVEIITNTSNLVTTETMTTEKKQPTIATKTTDFDETTIIVDFSGESSAEQSGDIIETTTEYTTTSTLSEITTVPETTRYPDTTITQLTQTTEPIHSGEDISFADTPVIIVEELQPRTVETPIIEGFESSTDNLSEPEMESSSDYDDDATCDCDHSIMNMIKNPNSLLMETLTKMIRKQIENELREEFDQQLTQCQNMASKNNYLS